MYRICYTLTIELGGWEGQNRFMFLGEISNSAKNACVKYEPIILQPCRISTSLCMHYYYNHIRA